MQLIVHSNFAIQSYVVDDYEPWMIIFILQVYCYLLCKQILYGDHIVIGYKLQCIS